MRSLPAEATRVNRNVFRSGETERYRLQSPFDGADQAAAASCELVKPDLTFRRSAGVGVEIIDAVLEHGESPPCDALQNLFLVAAAQ